MAYYKPYRKKPINKISKEIKEKYLSMTLVQLEVEKKKLIEESGRLVYETRSELWKEANSSENIDGSDYEEIYSRVEKSFPPLEKKLFDIFEWGKQETQRKREIARIRQEIWEKEIKDENSSAYKNYIIPLRKQRKLKDELIKKQGRYNRIQLILDAFPEIKKRVKKKEQSAKLAAYGNSSRQKGESIARNIKKNTEFPFRCPYCLSITEKDNCHVDHINPVSNGGLSLLKNMVLVCKSCNLKKKDNSLRIFCKENNLNYLDICERLENLGKFV